MTIIILLIGISLSIAVLFLGFFMWSVKSGQYDDTYTPSVRMLFEEKLNEKPKSPKAQDTEEWKSEARPDFPDAA